MTSTTTTSPDTTTGSLVFDLCMCVYLVRFIPIKRSSLCDQAIDALLGVSWQMHFEFMSYVWLGCMSQRMCYWSLWQNVCCLNIWRGRVLAPAESINVQIVFSKTISGFLLVVFKAYSLAWSTSHRRNDLKHNNLARHYYRWPFVYVRVCVRFCVRIKTLNLCVTCFRLSCTLHSVCYLSLLIVCAVCMILSYVSNVIRARSVVHTGEMTSTTTPLPSSSTGNLDFVLYVSVCILWI